MIDLEFWVKENAPWVEDVTTIKKFTNKVVRRTLEAVGQRFFKAIVPRRFSAADAPKYSLFKRSERYNIQKRKKRGFAIDRVNSGFSRTVILSMPRVTFRNDAVRIRPQKPDYFSKHKKNTHATPWQETHNLLPEEIDEIWDIIGEELPKARESVMGEMAMNMPSRLWKKVA